MRKFILGMIAGLLLSSGVVYAADSLNIVPNPYPVLIDGTKAEVEGYNINGRTFLKLRDFEKAGLKIDFKDNNVLITTKPAIEITKPTIETAEAKGGNKMTEYLTNISEKTINENGEEIFYSGNVKYITGDSLSKIVYSNKNLEIHIRRYRTYIYDIANNMALLENIPARTYIDENGNGRSCFEYDYYLNKILPIIK